MVSQAPRLWSRYQDFDRINQREEMMEVQSAVFIPAKAPNYMDEEEPNSDAKHYYNSIRFTTSYFRKNHGSQAHQKQSQK